MELNRTTMKRLMLLITFTVLLLVAVMRLDAVYAALQFILGILSPFVTGAVIAFILNVPMRFLEGKLFAKATKKKGVRPGYVRPLSLLLTLALVIAVLLIVILIVMPQLGETVSGLGATISAGINQLIPWAEEQFANNPQVVEWLHGIHFNWDQIIDTVVSFLRNGAGNVLNSTITAAVSIVNTIANFFIALIFSIYLLLQKEKLAFQGKKVIYALLPKKAADKMMEICSLSNRVFASFITGQCTEAVILGALFFVAMQLFRMPYALLVSCLISVTALIPIVGAFIGCAVGVFLLLFVSPVKALTFLIMFLILQQLEGNLIYPHVVGNSIGLPSIWVLAAVTLGGSLMGVAGMLFFIPFTSVVYTLFRQYVNRRLAEKNIKIK